MSAWSAISHGVVAKNNNKRNKYWQHWKQYTADFQVDPYLSNCNNTEKIIIITAYAARVRTGCYGRGNVVKVQSVTDALAAISTTIELAGESSPIYKADKKYKVPVARMVEGFRREDPPSTPQIAIPVKVVIKCLLMAYEQKCPLQQAIGDLSAIAFFYLLRVGEYIKPKTHKVNGITKLSTRTVQFAVEHIGFFKQGKVLPRHSPLSTLVTADSCTFKITNQKNGRMGQTIHQHATNKDFCQVRATARRVHHI